LVHLVTTMKREKGNAHLREVAVVQAADHDTLLAQAPAKERAPRLVPDGPGPAWPPQPPRAFIPMVWAKLKPCVHDWPKNCVSRPAESLMSMPGKHHNVLCTVKTLRFLRGRHPTSMPGRKLMFKALYKFCGSSLGETVG
jgi:hypothetical protein